MSIIGVTVTVPLPRKIILLVALLIGLSGCKDNPGNTDNAGLLSFEQFLESHRLEAPLPLLGDAGFPAQRQCTPLPDDAPYRQTIQAARSVIDKQVDGALFQEAIAYLTGGIVFEETDATSDSPYSAFFTKRSILLYSKLFDYGCVEDVVSTLVHEMVHAAQQSRHSQPGAQRGEHSLVGTGLDKTIAELEADGFQLHVSSALGLVGAAHFADIRKVTNQRRRQFNILMRKNSDL